jgi:putative redox protein
MQTAQVKWVGNQQFFALTPSGHDVRLDSDRKSNDAPGPMEMLLVALGACTATDVVAILAKKRQELASLEVVVSGERATEPPTVWVKLEIVYKLRGQLDEKAVRDAIELSENKYCSVAAMLRKTAPITFRYEISRAGDAQGS